MIFRNKNFKTAFSLIEISLVVLIVGILISGISLGVDIYGDFKLTTARQLTINSRVGRIENLVAWYETTNENVFSKGETNFEDLAKFEENQPINSWKDSNPKTSYKINATQTSSNFQPTIIFDKTTSLPIVRFGSGKFLNLPNGTVPVGNQPYTVIFVSKIDADFDCGCALLTSGVFDYENPKHSNNFEFYSTNRFGNVYFSLLYGVSTPDNTVSPNKFQIFSSVYDQDTLNVYINKNYWSGSATVNPLDNKETNNFIGKGFRTGNDFFIGSIAEIIIFNRNLLNSEREDIENYLSKKWSIKLGSK